MKYLFLFLFPVLIFASPAEKKEPLPTFVDRISLPFDDYKKDILVKYNLYSLAQDCITKSKSKQDIRICESILRDKLVIYNKQVMDRKMKAIEEERKLKEKINVQK